MAKEAARTNGKQEGFEKTLFKAADRKYRKNKMQFEEDFCIIVELGSLVV